MTATGKAGDMNGKTVLVTGATGGIGKVTARTLARLGARVVIVGRNPAKTAAVAREIGAASQIVADLSVMSEVRRAAAEFQAQERRLDVLVNNAGAVVARRQETPEGIEMTWALNHLNYFLLTHELTGLLKDTAQQTGESRVVSVSSSAHATGKMHWDDLEYRRGYSSFGAYGQSKLANILFTRELSRRLAGTGVTANALHPGFVKSGFGHNNSGLLSRAIGLLSVFAVSEEQGAQTSLYLASSPEVKGVSGRYFSNQQEVKPQPQALDDAAAARLWTVSEAYTEGSTG